MCRKQVKNKRSFMINLKLLKLVEQFLQIYSYFEIHFIISNCFQQLSIILFFIYLYFGVEKEYDLFKIQKEM